MTPIETPGLPAPAGHYAHAIRSGNLLFVSGVLPDMPGPLAAQDAQDDFERQVASVFDKCELTLQAGGCTLGDVVQATVYLAGVGYWPRFNALYAARMGAHKPARAVVPVPELHHGALVEVQLVAEVAPQATR